MGAKLQKKDCGCWVGPDRLVPCDDHKQTQAAPRRAVAVGSGLGYEPDEVKELVDEVVG